jgi:RNA polymerase-binding transcription factor DksA
MKAIRERLEQDLITAVTRLRQVDGAVALEEVPGPIASDGDEFGDVQELVRREIGFATRELLVARVNRLQAALDRLRDGEYGTCVECGEQIAPARLTAMPEVQTCVRCQDRLERMGRWAEEVEAEVGADDDD